MAPESVPVKARRLLGDGRLHVRLVEGDRIQATCRGDHGTYALGFDGRGWFCDCAAYGACSHLAALMLVAVNRAEVSGASGSRAP